MRLKISVPHEIILDEDVEQITAEGEEGSFGILPSHIDYVSSLRAGILSYVIDDQEEFLAIDEGILVKRGSQVMISTYKAIKDRPLGELQKAIDEEITVLSEHERKARSSLAMLEGGIIRKFTEQSQIE
ncbi:MAG TPA: F0F1 ATP synthase subunit epsilon [candidate division Zixibacteria bacterium]|nr:F0F1 ATP synthase subunit epsilon [candidate division Zixibacteria bacterium]